MGILNPNPVSLIHLLAYLDLMVRRRLFSLYQHSGINLVGQNSGYCLCRPDSLRIHFEGRFKMTSQILFVLHR